MATAEERACIDACNECLTSVNACLEKHLGEQAMTECLKLCLDCTNICSVCAQTLARGSAYANEVCNLCAQLCEKCSKECTGFDSSECQACAEACRICAQRCREMADHRMAA